MKFVHKLMIASCCALSLSAVSMAQNAFNDAERAIKYRKNGFSMLQNNFAAMGDMVRGDAPFDAAIFAERARAFAALSELPWAGFSVAGAQPGQGSDALPAIWQNWDDFNRRAEKLKTDAAALASAAASGDEGQMRQAFLTAARNCKACHDQYKD